MDVVQDFVDQLHFSFSEAAACIQHEVGRARSPFPAAGSATSSSFPGVVIQVPTSGSGVQPVLASALPLFVASTSGRALPVVDGPWSGAVGAASDLSVSGGESERSDSERDFSCCESGHTRLSDHGSFHGSRDCSREGGALGHHVFRLHGPDTAGVVL